MTVEDTLNLQIWNGNLIEFGVYHADTLRRLVKGFTFDEVWGFDSFQGLPADAINDGNPDWREGSFNVLLDDNFTDTNEAMAYIRAKVRHPKLSLVEGWFKDSLTADIGKKLAGTCSYAHIDTDIFSSTLDCLNWLFKYKVMKPGCIMRFDDWASGLQYNSGQPKAFNLAVATFLPSLERLGLNVWRLHDYS